MSTHEHDLRLSILNTLLTTPHRDLASIWPIHHDIVAQDPRFYVHLAAWYHDHGEVRDHKEMFVVALALSEFPGHRDVGLALLRQLPPYEVARVLDFVHGRKTERKPKDATNEAPKVVESHGLFRNPPRSLRTEIVRYLREREADGEWFDSTVLTARKALKRMYALLHVRPGERAQKILFDEEPPADSRLFALRKLAQATNPTEQAQAILEQNIPYRVAVAVVKQMTPTVLLAIIERMTPQELINNLGSLRRRGALDNPDLKGLIEGKLKAAKSDTRVSAYKAQVASEAAGGDPSLVKALDEVTDVRVKAKGRITRPTALLLDKSGSMSVALEIGRQLGALVSAVCETDLFAYAFDSIAYPIEPQGKTIDAWEKAMLGLHATGSTSCGVALDWMAKQGQRVEQLVLVTDEGENQAPFFRDAYEAYAKKMLIRPSVTIVKIGNATDTIEKACRDLGVPMNKVEFRGDYYALPNIVPLLSKPSQADLLMDILSYPLPTRKAG